MKKIENIVKYLITLNKTLSIMESCTGGYLTNCFTNVDGSSNVLKFSAVTYSNEFKIKMGVSSDIIDKYSVYSIETSKEMSNCITNFTSSNYGIGVTGKLNAIDPYNDFGFNNIVYYTIYDRDNNKYYFDFIKVDKLSRQQCKEEVVNAIIDKLYNILCEQMY